MPAIAHPLSSPRLFLLLAIADCELTFEEDDSARCIWYHRPGRLLFYKDTAIFPIGISVPLSLVAQDVPPKTRDMAPFVGSRRGGDTSEYQFGPLDEAKYWRFYAKHRFARTQKKGGWDALRHVEILAAGAVPSFQGLAQAPAFALPYLPVPLLLEAEQQLLPYGRRLELVYNATVRRLLAHARRCLSAESMAARVLRTLGLWPARRPLRLLYVACGWGYRSLDDGWQGPVSIGLFLGLQGLLRRHRGSRVVDAPLVGTDFLSEHTRRSHFWYTFERELGCRFAEEDLRSLMYGYGFSYARRLPRELMSTPAEQAGIQDAIRRREFDAVIYGKVGPTQGCDPLPFIDEVLEAGYPPERIALIYGGDFGLSNHLVARHVRVMGEFGTVFVREIDAPADERFSWRPASVLPSRCYTDGNWRKFFKLWEMRLRCWGCSEIDDAVLDALWPSVTASAGGTGAVSQGLEWWASDVGTRPQSEPCWSGLALLSLPLLARGQPESKAEHCTFAMEQVSALHARIADEGLHMADADFLEAFGVRPVEVYAFVCNACGNAQGRISHAQAACQDAEKALSSGLGPFASDFDAGVDQLSLSDLRKLVLIRNHIRNS